MSFHLTPYHNSSLWSPFRPFGQDMRLFRGLLDADSSGRGTPTVEPSYSYEADDQSARFEIEMPGVAKGDVSIEVDAHKLVVRGRRYKKGAQSVEVEHQEDGGEQKQTNGDAAKEQKAEQRTPSLIYLLEARLGHGADLDHVKADHCGDGIITVEVPVKTDKGVRRIQLGV